MWKWACLVPHPPIIVPEVGHGREKEAHQTLNGMKELTYHLKNQKPDILFLLSPHAPQGSGLFFLETSCYAGDLSMFGAPQVSVEIKSDGEKCKALYSFLQGEVPISHVQKEKVFLDHASLVPLYFFHKAWGVFPTLIVANPMGLSLKEALKTGEILQKFKRPGESWGLIASGDLSHRVTRDAPAGYSPLGSFFDEQVVHAIKMSDPEILLDLPSRTIYEAGECGLRSALVFLALSGEKAKPKLLSYEAPFGVGYATAIAVFPWKTYPSLARHAIETYVREGERLSLQDVEKLAPQESLQSKKACFVSLKTLKGELRGCIGTIAPVRSSLAWEVVENAIAAATEDPRFLPVRPEELPNLTVSIDILSEPEVIRNVEELDPKQYGVIVSKGNRRGVLLPDLEGITLASQQIQIAAQKAGITTLDGISISRFTVHRYPEREDTP
ncbi:AmmeMemoRadiSam system protein A [Aminobacterium mobile]|uniref:AmmeMemoRadiSam system protein A n=1 Tax=Aminobacterium mobile TaxID=81467 RepID=UPI000465B0E2|nr:AmmeMemoRadiSam system protein A [Aminobacterium mobile]